VGGTCVNTGCTPTKTMVASAQVAHYARNAAKWGVNAENIQVDLPAVLARKNRVVQLFRGGNEKKISDRKNLKLYRMQARFTGPHAVQVGDDVIESEKIFIDTGTRAEAAQIPGIESVAYLTNESIMELQQIPEHLMILGGGYIGLEFGQMFRRFGSRVTVIHRRGQLLAREDPEIANGLQKALEAEGIEFRMNANTTKAEKQGAQIVLTLASGAGTQTVTGTHVLCATGRRPNTDDLDERFGRVGAWRREGRPCVHAHLVQRLPNSVGEYHGGEKSIDRESVFAVFAFHRSAARARRRDRKRSTCLGAKAQNRLVSDGECFARH